MPLEVKETELLSMNLRSAATFLSDKLADLTQAWDASIVVFNNLNSEVVVQPYASPTGAPGAAQLIQKPVISYRSTQCTIPIDKIFPFVGLAIQAYSPTAPTSGNIRVTCIWRVWREER